MTLSRALGLVAALALGSTLAACGDDGGATGTRALLAFAGPIDTPATFFDAPFPSDTRLTAAGNPVMTGFPVLPGVFHMRDFVTLAGERHGFALLPAVYVRFTGPLAPLARTDVIAAARTSPILIVNVDATSPDRGALVPLLAETLTQDDYTPANLLAFVPYPGFNLDQHTTYAAIVTTKLEDAAGAHVLASPELAALQGQSTGAGAVLAPLWPALADLGLTVDDLAAATVFTTGAPFDETLDLTDKALARYPVAIDAATLHLTTTPAHTSPTLCELDGVIRYPQFQTGTPPFDDDGRFRLDANGVPMKQRDEVSPITFAIPKTPMPAAGYPVILSIHGTGGYSDSMLAPALDDMGPDPDHRYFGRGTAFPLASVGIVSVSSAMPLNSQRIPNALETQYVNFNNLPVLRFNLTQGIVESRFLVRALTDLRILPAQLEGCYDPTLLGGAPAIKLDVSKLMATGQSMGGMYASMVTAVEPTIHALVPTGGGGYFGLQILINTVMGDAHALLAALLNTQGEYLSQLHPTMMLANLVYEPADPIVFVGHIIEHPAPGAVPRPVLETSAPADEYFPPPIYAALSAQYGHPRIGAALMPEVEASMALANRAPVTSYPVRNNVNGVTAGIQEFMPAVETGSGHQIYVYRNDTRYQLTCFFKTFVATGTPVIVEPKDDAVNFSCN